MKTLNVRSLCVVHRHTRLVIHFVSWIKYHYWRSAPPHPYYRIVGGGFIEGYRADSNGDLARYVPSSCSFLYKPIRNISLRYAPRKTRKGKA